jgi:hypothetical protein
MLEALRTHPALLKLDLYCRGVRLDGSCYVEEDGGRKILRTRAGLGSGLELILPGGLWTNVPVTERFVAGSPYTLHRVGGRYHLRLEAIRYCVTLGKQGPRNEPWVTNGEIIAGLEPPESSIRAIDWITSVGAVPTVCVFRPLTGTDLEAAAPPRSEDLVPVFRRLYEACMERGLPIGCAPNVHVSLVLQPESAGA